MRVARPVLVLAVSVLVAACSSSDGRSAPSTTASGASAPTTTAGPASTTAATASTAPGTTSTSVPAGPTTTLADTTTKLTVVVTNDDGIAAPGLDAVVTALQATPNLQVVVVAPATNQSGTGDRSTPGGAKGRSATTKSGVEGTAVDGYPADTVHYAVDVLHLRPDLVVSGANSGVNFGPLVPVSGTVGAARTAARLGIPAIAVSAGTNDPVSAQAGARFVVEEINAHRSAYGFGKNTAHTTVSINVPTCEAGTSVRGIVDVPVAATVKLDEVSKFLKDDCASTATNPVDDITALNIGFAARTVIPADL